MKEINHEKTYIRPSVVINSLRDSGYKNTAYALAELIDNSIQANAKCIRLACFEQVVENTSRRSTAVKRIAVLDDGYGMTEEILYNSLEFGASRNREEENGLGKFGMGLPNSSVSQCRRTDVWSWVNKNKIYHTYLDIDEISSGLKENIPYPVEKAIPDEVKAAFKAGVPESGTIVIWSGLDKTSWKTSKVIAQHTESLIGRIYRRFISQYETSKKNQDPVRVCFQPYLLNKSGEYDLISEHEFTFKANDVMYLMPDTTLPELPGGLGNISAFKLCEEKVMDIDLGNEVVSQVKIRTSHIKKEVVDAISAITSSSIGATIWGKHFQKNIGLSILRADRELDLIDNYFLNDNRNRDRYISVEVEFQPVLDDFFGVTNNKQLATNIKHISSELLAEQAGFVSPDGTVNIREYEDDLSEDNSIESLLIKVNQNIVEMIKTVYKELDGWSFASRVNNPDKLGKVDPADKEATIIQTTREPDKKDPTAEEVETVLIESGMPPEEVSTILDDIISNKLKVKFITKKLSDDTIYFDIGTSEGFTLIIINENHLFYKNFSADSDEEQQKLLKLSLAAWAQMEKEQVGERKSLVINTRRCWGQMLDNFCLLAEKHT